MTLSYLHYELRDGFVQNWLAAGPQAFSTAEIDGSADAASFQELAERFYSPDLEINDQPVERGQLTDGILIIGDYQGSWSYYRCLEDHLVNHSGRYRSAHYLRSWAYTELFGEREIEVQLRLSTTGPADVWVNQEHVLRKDTWGRSTALAETTTAFSVHLAPGANPICVRFENLAVRDCVHFLALQVTTIDGAPLGSGEKIHVQVPTVIMPGLIPLRNQMEQLLSGIYLEKDVFERNDVIAFHLPDDPSAAQVITVRLMNAANIILNDNAIEGQAGKRHPLVHAYELTGGRYKIEILPRVYEYYEHHMRIKKDFPFWTGGNAPYASKPYGTYAERRREVLLKAVEQEKNLFAEIAKMALNWWHRLEPQTILTAIEHVNRRLEGSVLELVGLSGILYRFGDDPDFPKDIRLEIEGCIQNFRYAQEDPGHDVMDFTSEPGQILFSTCELLAGQHFVDRVFTNTGQPGAWHLQRGMQNTLLWLQDRAAWGFKEWSSSEAFTKELIALSLLVDLVEDDQVQELATVLLDKIFFTLALNTYRGILGTPRRQAAPEELKGSMLQATTGISRLMWGVGVFNHRIEGTTSLALMEQYEFPTILENIATTLPEELWCREQQAGNPSEAAGGAMNQVLYKTPDYMLSSAQDYRAGQKGEQEQVWQATLGFSANVFVNHPGSSSEAEAIAPGYWLGNAALPRVAQWKNALAGVYNLPENDWMGFTHAYFPTQAFDEYNLRDQWAFGRKGDGYLAITSSTGMELVTHGPHAYRELRATGRQVIWVCHMGRAAVDGDFAAFQERILGLPINYNSLSVRFQTLQGEELSFGWEGPFVCEGKEIPLGGFPHYDNAYTKVEFQAGQMDIIYGDTLMRLDFSTPSNE